MLKQTFFYLFIGLVWASCEEEIPLDKLNPYTEKLVVNEIFTNDDVFSIQISNSKDAYQSNNPQVLDSSKLKVVLLENNVVVPLVYDVFADVFNSNIKPQAGKTYTLKVSSGSFTPVTAVGVVPPVISNKTATYTQDGGIDMQGNKSDLLKISFQDDPATKDYYKVNFFYYSELVDKFNAFEFEAKDVLAAINTTKTRDGGYLFSDETFSGQLKTITAVPPAGLVKFNTGAKYLIQIERLSSDYWKYNTTLEQYRGSLSGGTNSTNLFRGAVVVYSNVVNGLGIFAGSSIERDTIK
jgi:hypothetical protein